MKKKMKKSLAEWLKEVDVKAERNLIVYETERREIQAEKVLEPAKRFDVEGKVETDGNVHLVRQGKKAVAIYKNSGAFWYADFAKLHNPDYRPELPPEGKAKEIAVNYLKQKEGWRDGVVLDGVHPGQFERVEGLKRGKREVRPNHLCVDFRFSINALNTYGPGAKIKVFLGHKGEVIGVFHAARTIHKYAEFPPVSRRDLEEVLRRKLGFPIEKIEVRGVKLVYFADSPVLDSRFVQPVYVFTLAAPIRSLRGKGTTPLEFETHPLPATLFAPIATINTAGSRMEIKQGERLTLSCKSQGGKAPFKFSWDSDIDGHLSDEPVLETDRLSIAHRSGSVTSHTIKVTVTDSRGCQDSHQVAVRVSSREEKKMPAAAPPKSTSPKDPNDPYVGVEWCNLYHGSAPDISGTDASAQGFKNHLQSLPGWSTRFDWGNDNAWEEDFKFATAPGGGADSYWADNIHFAFFAGHGSSGSFWFGSTVDDHEMRAQDARWGDGILNWVVLHACQTMRANFEWVVWCDAFVGLHQMFGFHTNTEGSTPPLGSRFAFWMSFRMLPWIDAFDMQTAWKLACGECFDSSVEYAGIYAGQTGTDTFNDHLPSYGYVSPDPTSPSYWAYYRGTC